MRYQSLNVDISLLTCVIDFVIFSISFAKFQCVDLSPVSMYPNVFFQFQY